jgi:hypothetical protein
VEKNAVKGRKIGPSGLGVDARAEGLDRGEPFGVAEGPVEKGPGAAHGRLYGMDAAAAGKPVVQHAETVFGAGQGQEPGLGHGEAPDKIRGRKAHGGGGPSRFPLAEIDAAFPLAALAAAATDKDLGEFHLIPFLNQALTLSAALRGSSPYSKRTVSSLLACLRVPILI